MNLSSKLFAYTFALGAFTLPSIAQEKDWYSTFSVGMGNFVPLTSTVGTVNFDPGFSFDVGIGKYISENTALEFSYDSHSSYGWKFWNLGVRDTTTSHSVLISPLLEFGKGEKWKPFIGPSIGASWVSNGGETASSFAYGVQGGLSYEMNDNSDLILKISHVRASRLDYSTTWVKNGGYTSIKIGTRF